MDLAALGRVFWRFKYLVILGLLVACGLAFISAARVNTSTWKVSYRGTEQWASYSKVFVTQKGFPWGAVNAPTTTDPTRFTSLALIYANLINGDAVTRRMDVQGKLPGTVEAAALLTSPGSSDALPIISIAGLSDSKEHSLALTGHATNALIGYVDALQRQNGIPDDNRVWLQEIQSPGQSKLLAGRSKTVPVMVFLAVLIAVVALVLVLENVRPRVRAVEESPDTDSTLARPRLSA
jgi:hypothetical protein